MDLFNTPLFPNLIPARFLRRLNRFVIECDLDGKTVAAHLPNPGRLWELLLPGRPVSLVENAALSQRRTPYTAVAVERDGVPVLLHTSMANTVVRFLLEGGRLPNLEDARIIRQEAAFGRSRFDFLLQRGKDRMILEVKSCTLFGKHLAMFPDAVSHRGARHLRELAGLAGQGYACGVVFVVSTPRVDYFLPDYHTDFEFTRTLAGVKNVLTTIAVSVRWRNDLTLTKDIRDLPIPWTVLEKEGRDRGCYILILHLSDDHTLTAGSLGPLFFPKGYYLYAGSAKANLTKRLERHGRKRKNQFWHIDYLREAAASCQALPIRTGDDLEHDLARRLGAITDGFVPRFGASDCRCPSHLFFMADNPVHHPAFVDLLQYVRMDRLTIDNENRF